MQIHFDYDASGDRRYIGMAQYPDWQHAKIDVLRSTHANQQHRHCGELVAWTYIEGRAKRLFSVLLQFNPIG